jgi:hypothetical protein
VTEDAADERGLGLDMMLAPALEVRRGILGEADSGGAQPALLVRQNRKQPQPPQRDQRWPTAGTPFGAAAPDRLGPDIEKPGGKPVVMASEQIGRAKKHDRSERRYCQARRASFEACAADVDVQPDLRKGSGQLPG